MGKQAVDEMARKQREESESNLEKIQEAAAAAADKAREETNKANGIFEKKLEKEREQRVRQESDNAALKSKLEDARVSALKAQEKSNAELESERKATADLQSEKDKVQSNLDKVQKNLGKTQTQLSETQTQLKTVDGEKTAAETELKKEKKKNKDIGKVVKSGDVVGTLGWEDGKYIVLTSNDTKEPVSESDYESADSTEAAEFCKEREAAAIVAAEKIFMNNALPGAQKTWSETVDAAEGKVNKWTEDHIDKHLKGVVNKVKGVARGVYDSMATMIPSLPCSTTSEKSKRRLIPLEF